MTGRKSGHLHLVAEEVIGSGKGIHLSLEVALLMVPARPPAQAAAYIEVFAEDVPHHVGGRDAFGGTFIVRAAGRVNVMIARVPARGRGMRPAAKLECFFI